MQRRQQGAAFTPDAMDAYLPRVVATCESYLEQWASQDSINLVPAVSGPLFMAVSRISKLSCTAGKHVPGPSARALSPNSGRESSRCAFPPFPGRESKDRDNCEAGWLADAKAGLGVSWMRT